MRKHPRSALALVVGLGLFSSLASERACWAISASPHPVKVNQPDGAQVRLFLRGDEYFHFYEDERGYTVIRRDDAEAAPRANGAAAAPAVMGRGWYTYAALNADQTKLVPTELKVGVDQPTSLTPRILPRPDVLLRNRERALAAPDANPAQPIRPVGDVRNLVVLMRFKNHASRAVPPPSTYDVIFNKVGGDASLAPTGSIRDVYLENSYGAMRLNSTVMAWVDLSQTEAFYADSNSGLTNKIFEAIREALSKIDGAVDFRDFDQDHDGRIDAIAFIHSGYGAEWGGTDADGSLEKDRIWSHKSTISPTWTSNEGVKVNDYHISTGFWETSGFEPTHIGVVAHETGHFFGLPDLYDYSRFGSGVGSWSMMANSWGFDGTQQHPPQFCAWSKVTLGWVNPTTLTAEGTYTAPAVEKTPAIFKIAAGYPSGEYLLIENRQPLGHDITMPAGPGGVGGLAIWHVDETKPLNNDPGFPGQAGWPGNGKHYKVALLQADGRFDLERSSQLPPAQRFEHGSGDGEDLFRSGHKTEINAMSTPDTNGYQGGTVTRPGHRISQIGASGPSIAFAYDRGTGTVPEPGTLAGGLGFASAQFSYEERKTARGNAVIAKVAFHLDQPVDVHVQANTSAASADDNVNLIVGFGETDTAEEIWSESLRATTLSAGRWSSTGSTYATRMDKGDHVICWKVWTGTSEVTFASGSMLIQTCRGTVGGDGGNQGRFSAPGRDQSDARLEIRRDASGRSVTINRGAGVDGSVARETGDAGGPGPASSVDGRTYREAGESPAALPVRPRARR